MSTNIRRISMRRDRAIVTAAVRGVAFAAVTFAFISIPMLSGFLWCVYIGFFLTMAFGAKRDEYKNYLCSLLIGYLWAFLYVNAHMFLEGVLGIPSKAAIVLAEFVLTFILLFIHIKLLGNTPFNKIPAVFAAVATIFASGGTENTVYCAVSAAIGITMATLTEMIIVRIMR